MIIIRRTPSSLGSLLGSSSVVGVGVGALEPAVGARDPAHKVTSACTMSSAPRAHAHVPHARAHH